MKADRGQWVPKSMPYDVESRKKFKPSIKPKDVSDILDRVGTYKKGPKAKTIPGVTPEKDVYSIICERLAWPNSIRLRRLLEWEFSLLEMEVCHVIKDVPQDKQAEALSEWLDVPVTKMREVLESLFQKGAIFPKEYQNWTGFRFLPRGLYQLHDGGMTNAALDLKYGPTVYNLWNDFAVHDESQRISDTYNKWRKIGGRP
ncbi:MAG: hypothetical protein NTV30_06075, partial [Chloroflexi bacterium]|nr:hypothetical protein [Chloroflexota bacterium]